MPDFDWFDMPPRSATTTKDISRILDPSYTTTTSYSSSAAYLDPNGHLHDPDYRHFPMLNQHSSRPRWETFAEDALDDEQDASFSSYQQQRLKRHHHYNNNTPLPSSFGSSDDENVLDALEDDFVPRSSSSTSSHGHGVSQFILRTKRELTKKRRSLDYYYPSSSPSSSSPLDLFASSSSTSSPSTAPIKAVVDTDTASQYRQHYPLTQTLSLQSTSRSNRSPRASFDLPSPRSRYNTRLEREEAEEEEEEEPTSLLNATEDAEDDSANVSNGNSGADWTPTCSQALKRQWQAFSLSVRFSVFRAQKRVKSRLAMI